jgi:hypothetical protein
MAIVGRFKLAGGAVAVLAVVALAGCGSTPARHTDRAVAGRALDAATRSALATSFEAKLSGSVKLSQQGVSGLSSSTLQKLTQLEGRLNSSTLVGSVEFQSPTDFEASYRFAPAFPASVDVIEVGGVRYASIAGSGWHEVPATPTGGEAASSSGSLGQALSALGGLARNATSITTLPPTQLDGQAVDHLQARISGPGLDRILTQALSASPARGGGADIPALGSLLNFYPVRGGLSFNLAALGLLGSAGAPQAQGTLTLTFEFTVTMSGYGSHFAIAKPSDVAPGPLPTPTPPALSSLF